MHGWTYSKYYFKITIFFLQKQNLSAYNKIKNLQKLITKQKKSSSKKDLL